MREVEEIHVWLGDDTVIINGKKKEQESMLRELHREARWIAVRMKYNAKTKTNTEEEILLVSKKYYNYKKKQK